MTETRKRYGLLRTVISKDKRVTDRIYIPIYSDDLKKLNESYDFYIKHNYELNYPVFNEVAIFDYEKCAYVKNNFNDRTWFVNNIRR